MVSSNNKEHHLRDTNQNQQHQQQQTPQHQQEQNVIIPSWIIGLLIRCSIAYSIPKLMDHTNVPYTDIDYYVFTDSIQYIQNGYNPYNRITYRYTPFLAYILSKLPYQRLSTRYIFCIADTFCGYIIIKIRQQQRKQQQNQEQQQNDDCINTNKQQDTTKTTTNDQQFYTTKSSLSSVLFKHIQNLYYNNNFIDAVWWLYNPLPINICTRGSAESLIVLLPVLITTWILLSLSSSSSSSSISSKALSSTKLYSTTIIAGICHGISIHAKLYPIIYTLSYVTYLVVTIEQQQQQKQKQKQKQKQENSNSIRSLSWHYQRQQFPQSSFVFLIIRWIYYWILKLIQTPIVWIFSIVTVITFISITYLSYIMYGTVAIQEGLLYHFSRVDHRHNYSIHWYWIYLVRYIQEHQQQNDEQQQQQQQQQQHFLLFNIVSMTFISRLLVLPQIIILLISSLHLASYSLTVALFVQTFIFVIQNKVITAQYFTWYLCFLPLCTNTLFISNTTTTTTTSSTNIVPKKIITVFYSVLIVLVSIVIWLLSAYCLEMLGMAVHLYVWIASILYYIANVNLLRSLLVQSSSSSPVVTPLQPVLGTKSDPDNDVTLKKHQ